MRWRCRAFLWGSGQTTPRAASSSCCPQQCWTLTLSRHMADLEFPRSCSYHTLVSTVWGDCKKHTKCIIKLQHLEVRLEKRPLVSVSRWPFWLNKRTALPLSYVGRNPGGGKWTRHICASEPALWCVRQRGSNEECISSTIPTVTGISPGWSWLHRFRPTSWAASKHNTQEPVQTHLQRLQRWHYRLDMQTVFPGGAHQGGNTLASPWRCQSVSHQQNFCNRLISASHIFKAT